MSKSNEWTEWHLTPNGWIPGSEKLDHTRVITKEPPVDRVYSFEYREEVPYNTMNITSTTIYGDETSQEVQELLEKFPKPYHFS